MATREGLEEALVRQEQLELLQEEYAQFLPFLEDVMIHLGFKLSKVQADIGQFIAHGPHYQMVQAQRGQAKTTITAAFAVWTIIHDPRSRVLVVSAGGKQANEISTLIVRLIMTMDELECLRPDASNGDRTSVEAFDVHYSLKGVDKSPSVACVGITGNLQGKRASLLIADDVESKKNSRTATMQELLLELTRDFTSICEIGRIIYLGTPQSQESVYNTLPSRGFTVRIWTGRYPTSEQIENYGDMLAPYVTNRLSNNPGLMFGGGLLKDQGQPIDPAYLTEEVLQRKEKDQGPAYFQLQHMLNTRLADAARYPLKPENLVVMRLGSDYYPMTVARGLTASYLRPYSVGATSFHMSLPIETADSDVGKLQGLVMYVDPAGGGKNGDETGYAVTGFLNGNIFVLAAGGLPGGYSVDVLNALSAIAKKWQVNKVIIEKNMGYGAFREVWVPLLHKEYKCAVEDDMVHGQKELRIIETLEPVMARGSLVFNEDVVDEDRRGIEKYPSEKRGLYSIFHQMARITRDRDCLYHDDRLDALEGAVRHWVQFIAIDQDEAIKRARAVAHKEAMKDPMGYSRYRTVPKRGGSVFNKYRR